jgi:hypothetical protein
MMSLSLSLPLTYKVANEGGMTIKWTERDFGLSPGVPKLVGFGVETPGG